MKAAIDISNLQGGGGLHSILDLLHAADPTASGFSSVTVWGDDSQLRRLPDRPWLKREKHPLLSSGRALRFVAQSLMVSHHRGYDVIFAPGGIQRTGAVPVVGMAHNLLPFDAVARGRCSSRGMLFRYWLLNRLQSRTLTSCAGTIFLTEFAAKTVQGVTGPLPGRVIVIPHGISPHFGEIRNSREKWVRTQRPFRWLYVSPVTFYKHHLELIEAADLLQHEGFPIELRFVGGHDPFTMAELQPRLRLRSSNSPTIDWRKEVQHGEIRDHYQWADGFVFTSSCENFPLTLLEAMASGLPVVCSDRSGLPDISGGAAAMVDPTSPLSIRDGMRAVMADDNRRRNLSARALERVGTFTWQLAAHRTFEFLRQIARPVEVGQ